MPSFSRPASAPTPIPIILRPKPSLPTDIHRQTYTQTDIQTRRHRDKQRQTDRHTHRQTYRHADTETNRETHRQTYTQRDIQTQTDRPADTQTQRQTERHTDRHHTNYIQTFITYRQTGIKTYHIFTHTPTDAYTLHTIMFSVTNRWSLMAACLRQGVNQGLTNHNRA